MMLNTIPDPVRVTVSEPHCGVDQGVSSEDWSAGIEILCKENIDGNGGWFSTRVEYCVYCKLNFWVELDFPGWWPGDDESMGYWLITWWVHYFGHDPGIWRYQIRIQKFPSGTLIRGGIGSGILWELLNMHHWTCPACMPRECLVQLCACWKVVWTAWQSFYVVVAKSSGCEWLVLLHCKDRRPRPLLNCRICQNALFPFISTT